MASIQNNIVGSSDLHDDNPWVELMEPGVVYTIPTNERQIQNLRKSKRDLEKSLSISMIFNIFLFITFMAVAIFACVKFKALNESFQELSAKYEEAYETHKATNQSFVEYASFREAINDLEIPQNAVPDESNTPVIASPVIERDIPHNDISLYADVPLDEDVKQYIFSSALAGEIPPQIMFSLAWKESTFTPDAVSASDDHGLFQINRVNFTTLANHFGYTMEEFTIAIYDPYVNTDCAIYILSSCRDNYTNSDWHQVLMRYNMGPGGAAECFAAGKYSSGYSRDILNYAQDCFSFTDIDF